MSNWRSENRHRLTSVSKFQYSDSKHIQLQYDGTEVRIPALDVTKFELAPRGLLCLQYPPAHMW